jgi:hypothetical protein
MVTEMGFGGYMSKQNRVTGHVSILPYIIGSAVVWTVVIGAFIAAGIILLQLTMLDVALSEAMASFEQDSVYRRWAARHGEAALPQQLKRRQTTVQSHITSLKPSNPKNAPDTWEASALNGLAKGAKEVSSVVMFDGMPYVRFIRPLITEKSCLKCHAVQGYREGDIRGGISVAQPLQYLMAVRNKNILFLSLGLCLLWLLGLSGIGLAAWAIKKSFTRSRQEEGER